MKPVSDDQIHEVADTAIWVAGYRAMESERPDALFRDPLAGRLAGERGRTIALTMAGARQFGWTIVVRTSVIDSLIHEAIAKGFDAVLNLGAGLDTRPYRLELPSGFQWFEVDHPKLIELKNHQLAGEVASCALERISADLTNASERTGLLDQIAKRAEKILVLTEGVIPYLSQEEVAALARDLGAHASYRAWIADYSSPFLNRQMRRQRDLRKRLRNAPRRFSPIDWEGFFQEQGWRLTEMRYLSVEGKRRGRPAPLPWWFQALNMLAFRRFDGEVERMLGYGLLEPVREI
ncbi:MAG TPA: SAM-dependent methyltransferase [Polyangiaceae bacterium]|nr:SAM-dependent methyltransferase [Polyangiaceae bacterium]